MKDYIKSALVLILSAISAYTVYLLLLVLNILHYYEFADCDWKANIPVNLIITVLFIIFNFIGGYIFKPNIKKCIILQGTYLLISLVLIFVFDESDSMFINDLISALCSPNIILGFWYEIFLYTKNIFIQIIVCVSSVILPVLATVSGVLVRKKKRKIPVDKN